MKSLRCREDEAAWLAWQEGVKRGEQCLALMRRIIEAVDAVRALDAYRDRNETTRDGN
ncbi:hypothetical protein [Methylibium sp.]|uniref:hypothetical protein n=1 Tax=Methylibium sp. TaxID=2067992 RepID=UPI00178FF7E6|nr:hypothetical protein [Methylibium sp.]MBA3588857.1 hypothetical protein [Methylibium sp.]